MKARHKQSRDPRGHWLLLLIVLPAMFGALLFEGWTTHEVDAAKTRSICSEPAPKAVRDGGPVLRVDGGRVDSARMPARTVALTIDGGPDPVWTPRFLKLLREHHARATFFVRGAEAAKHPGLVERIRAEGHEIGSGTYTGAAMDRASSFRSSMELALTQTALAGAANMHTHLLRMPQTATPDTLCGEQWTASKRAAGKGYLLVAADKESRDPARGAVQKYDQSDIAYARLKKELGDKDVKSFTSVSGGLGLPPDSANEPTSTLGHWPGKVLIWAKAAGDAFVSWMSWVLLAAVGLNVLRMLLVLPYARAHVRRLERFRPGAPWLREVNEPVTVLVPAYNEEAGIASTLDSLLACTHPYLQIIVIDDGSTDRTAEIAARYGHRDRRVTVIRQANAGKAAALNTGLAHARCPYVVMVDADTVFDPDAVRCLVQPLAHPAVGAVSGNTKVGNRRRLLGRWQHLEYVFGFNLDRRMFEMLECMSTVPGAIGAFRLDALMGVGGVSDDTLAEDTDLTMALWRAGWRVVYEETAVAWTEVPGSLRQLWRQRYRWCYGTIQAMWKHRRAVREMGPAGRFGRRGLGYLALFQVALPLIAPVVDVFGLYGMLFLDPAQAAWVWLGFLILQLVTAGYALRLDGERLRALWAMPFQVVVYRQLMYLVVIQSVVAFLLGSRLKWQRSQRSGTAAQAIGQPVAYGSLTSSGSRR